MVVGVFTARRTSITLARITPNPTTTFLRPPTVVRTPEPVLYPISVTLAYSLRGKPIYFYTGVFEFPFVPDEGEVCGGDEAGSEVCGSDEAVTEICADESAGATATGLSSSESTISGGDSALGTVCGTDEQNI